MSDLTSEARVIGMPTYFRCGGEVAYDMDEIEIVTRDGTEFAATGEEVSVDEWVTFSIDGDGLGQLSVAPNAETMFKYRNSYHSVDIIALDPLGGDAVVDVFMFYIGDLIKTECQKSIFELVSLTDNQMVQVNAPEPVTFQLQPPTDSGTVYLHSLRAFRSFDCGEYSYTQ